MVRVADAITPPETQQETLRLYAGARPWFGRATPAQKRKLAGPIDIAAPPASCTCRVIMPPLPPNSFIQSYCGKHATPMKLATQPGD